MISLSEFIQGFPLTMEEPEFKPWDITNRLPEIVESLFAKLSPEFRIVNNMAIHDTAHIEEGAVIKGPVIIGEGCYIASHTYLRGGVLLCSSVKIGPGCEIKSSIICDNTSVAHFNFIGDSVVGSRVNFEAGSLIANHFNERADKRIFVLYNNRKIDTGVYKFGALVGDDSKIGANAVLSPGTLLKPSAIVKRLELIEQV